jgi:hypothetical protein
MLGAFDFDILKVRFLTYRQDKRGKKSRNSGKI